jgi:hypothetical protein
MIGNYQRALQDLFDGGWIPANWPTVIQIVCAHDDHCGIYDEALCDCNVEISVDPDWHTK